MWDMGVLVKTSTQMAVLAMRTNISSWRFARRAIRYWGEVMSSSVEGGRGGTDLVDINDLLWCADAFERLRVVRLDRGQTHG
jgi:hypothetical protein